MAQGSSSLFLDGRLRDNFVQLIATDGAAIYVDGAVGTPNPPAPRSGNPFIDPLTGQRYPGAPG
jgi:hypothetical protein